MGHSEAVKMKHEFLITVEFDKDGSDPAVSIEVRPRPPLFAALMVATEHMMTMTALESEAGFKRGLELLVEGAKSNKVKVFHGRRVQ